MTEASITRPSSEIVTWTWTAPEARAALALGGYCGWIFLSALACRTPPDSLICFGGGGGSGFGGGGGGGGGGASSVLPTAPPGTPPTWPPGTPPGTPAVLAT